tara:strand:+ start:338 stop:724 length:387 start_codon:yes stop_codon:yes gene_type:complete
MLQNGMSRELFERWCTKKANGVVIPGYCVDGTLAKHVMSEPEVVTTMSGMQIPLRMSVRYISFSAHTDYKQTREFVDILDPPYIILVHGDANEMGRLKRAVCTAAKKFWLKMSISIWQIINVRIYNAV